MQSYEMLRRVSTAPHVLCVEDLYHAEKRVVTRDMMHVN